MASSRVLLIGWDAADWKVIDPLLAAGQMPNLARLIAGGVRGNIATIYPSLSPMLWTSIATGKRPYKHGIHGFTEPLPDGSGVRPVTNLARTTKAVWNILNQNSRRSLVTGWWPSHPAEPIDGVMVSDLFQVSIGDAQQPRPLPPGTVFPPERAAELADLRVHPMEIEGEILRMFVPEYERVDQAKDIRLHALVRTLAHAMSVHATATELLATERWDFAAVYYDAIDHFSHLFMPFHPPRVPWVSAEEFEIYQHVMAAAYRYHDAMLGGLLRFADENTTVVLLSDHGFHADEHRIAHIPAEPAGLALEHRHFGMLCMAGPELRRGETIHGASVLDICPTILTLFGLPVGKDMDGKVLTNAFRAPPALAPIPSWDAVPGRDGRHPPETQLDATASAAAFRQLVELGYVAPPAADAAQDVAETVRESQYNLARAWRDGRQLREAATLAEALWMQWPREHRFGLLYIDCLTGLDQVLRRGEAIEELQQRIERYAAEARVELARLPKYPEPGDNDFEARRADYERRRLQALTNPGTLTLEWLMASQAHLEGQTDRARRSLLELLEMPGLSGDLTQCVAGALVELGQPVEAEAALRRILESDTQNPAALGYLADALARQERWSEAVEAAADSLSLIYFQPGLHALLGQGLMQLGDYEAAEKELKVAIAQQPRTLRAHEALGQLYREHLRRPDEAFAHEGLAATLRIELEGLRREHRKANAAANRTVEVAPKSAPAAVLSPASNAPSVSPASAAPFASSAPSPEIPPSLSTTAMPALFAVESARVITVVSGLPRSGTSLMMQLLQAGGIEPLADQARAADADNLFGYLELQKATTLATDATWLPEARGKAVKIVAQLLPALPATEYVQAIVMRRDLREVLASQKAMLTRLGRPQSTLSDEQLMQTYAQQLARCVRRLTARSTARVLVVDYAELLRAPRAQVERIAQFLARPFQIEAAVAAVRPELRRQSAE